MKKKYAEKFLHQGEMKFSRPTCFHELEFTDDLRKDVQDGLCREKIIIKGNHLLERDIIKIGSKNKKGKQYILDVKKFRSEKHIEIHADDDIVFYLTYVPDNFIYCLTKINQREPNFLDLTNKNIFSHIKKLGDWSVIILKEKEFQEQFVTHYKSLNLKCNMLIIMKKHILKMKKIV